MKRMTTVVAMATAIQVATGVVTAAYGDVSVEDVKCAQRYPWNGLVDIEYTIACDDPEAEIYVNAVGFNGDTGLTVFPTHFTGDGATNTVKAGKHTMVWDARADMGNLFATKNFQIKMYAGKTLAPYIVVDLSSGPDGDNFPVRLSMTGPDISNDTCRTTELWLRLIPPGTFMMGSPADELGRNDNEDLHKVTITEPFYMGVFEVTHEQWYRVKGSWGSYGDSHRCLPVQNPCKYWDLRGDVAQHRPAGTTVSSDGFFGKLRTKTNLNGFDLPTEAQWEYACRAGTTTALNNGTELSGVRGCNNLNELGRYYVNGHNGSNPGWNASSNLSTYKTAKVGSYLPNAYGLYDMHGNLMEMCRDAWVAHLGASAEQNPLPEGTINGDAWYDWGSVIKGGGWDSEARWCRSAARGWYHVTANNDTVGFRVSCSGNLQK